MLAGIVHFAGTTQGNAERLCHEALKYPLFIPAVVPLYLSVVVSFQLKCPASSQWNYSSGACNRAVKEVADYAAANSISIQYNPGRCKNFSWPPFKTAR